MNALHFPTTIEQLAVDALVPYARNSRTHSDAQIAQVAASIREFGFTNPVLIDGAGGIIAGHGRVMAARSIGLAQVPCIRLGHLTEAQRRAYVIADNKLALMAGWDDDVLASELRDLQAMDFDLELTGFSDDDLRELLVDPDAVPVGDGKDPDAVPAAPVVPASRAGDVWVMGKHRVMCGDSTQLSSVERLMAGGRAAMIFTDPPYGVDYDGINNDSRAGLEALLEAVFTNYQSVSEKGAAFYCFHSDRCADIFHRVYRSVAHFSSMVVWVKPSLVLSQTDYQSRHEPCLYGWLLGAPHAWFSDRKQTSVWSFGKESVVGHTTPKPVELIEAAIGNSSKRGYVVADFFGGSGSTLIACEKTDRQARLIELDPKYVDVIVRRWQEFTGGGRDVGRRRPHLRADRCGAGRLTA